MLLQEAEYVSAARIGNGYILNSPKNTLRIWTRHKMIVLKNIQRIQIIETKIRKKDIDELLADLIHLLQSYSDSNIVCSGDFNEIRSNIPSLGLVYRTTDESSWRKNRKSRYSTAIDHFLSSECMDVSMTYHETEADHKAIIGNINTLGECKGISFLSPTSHLSKILTLKVHPRDWQEYPRFELFGWLGPNKTRQTVPNEQMLKELRETRKKEVRAGSLCTKSEWRRAMRFVDLKPYTYIQPLLDSNNQIITGVAKYVDVMLKGLVKATGAVHKRVKHHKLEIKEH